MFARLIVVILCLAASVGAALAADGRSPLPKRPPPRGEASQTSKPDTPSEAYRVTGFRSARFGMTEAEVRSAVAADFPAQAESVTVETNPVERTSILSFAVPDLLPNAGTARVGHVLGYKSRTLIQTQVVWGRTIDPSVTPASLVDAARMLENHLNEAGFPPRNVVAEAELPNGEILVFRGVDSGGRMTTLVLSGDFDTVDGKRKMTPTTLRLSYILDPKNPDVFHLDRGAF